MAIETDCGGGVVAVETAVVAAVGGFLHGQKYWLQDVCPQIQADLPCTTSRHLLTLCSYYILLCFTWIYRIKIIK